MLNLPSKVTNTANGMTASYSYLADGSKLACTVNPQNGHIMELKFTVYNLHDNVLVNNISVRKLAALENQLKANLIFDNIPSEYQDASFVLGV